MTDKVRKYKAHDELDPDELLKVVQAQRRGEPTPKFLTDEYRQATSEALTEAGLEPDDESDESKSIEEMSVGDHLARIRKERP
jgi:hypothetical protein